MFEYTNFYIRFGLGRDFDPTHPGWQEYLTGLRELGFRAAEARRAAEYSETLQDATLEDRMRLALVFLCPKPRVEARVGTCVTAST